MLPSDSAWLALERPDNPMTITIMLRVDGLTPGRFREFLEVYWLAWERFRCRPVWRAPAWYWEKDPTFAPPKHLDVALDRFEPGELQNWVSERLNEPLPLYRPRWKFWLAPNARGGAALLLRLHHCYADGLSLLGVFDQLCPASPRQYPAVYGAREAPELGRWFSSAQAWLEACVAEVAPVVSGSTDDPEPPGKGRVGKVFETGTRLVHDISELLVSPDDTPSDLKRPLLGRRNCRWSPPVPLAHFRDIARATRTTINDVLLACVAAAVKPRLGMTPEQLEDAVLHAAVPVDIRAQLPEGVQPEDGALGNCFGTVFVPLPVDGHSALERLFRVKHETRKLKKSWQPGLAWGLTSCASLIPEPGRRPLADLFFRKASAVVSNVPGTPETRYLAGCAITEQMFWVPQAGDIGLGVSIVSYGGQVQFGVVADESVLPDPSAFLDDCLNELDQFPGRS
ncbi:WS/DGAT domain-containing protein [Marinobacter daepoensis]|uniref:WS/DGAT domain-containing protein n=1 Tax=Marinobacter daepoensis TaxID=262077 RepID=UPI000A070546|nr:WS/DGAT domain-containing protein [Marinobacter daepoensis]